MMRTYSWVHVATTLVAVLPLRQLWHHNFQISLRGRGERNPSAPPPLCMKPCLIYISMDPRPFWPGTRVQSISGPCVFLTSPPSCLLSSQKKKRTHVEQDESALPQVPRTFVMERGRVGNLLNQLVLDLRQVMEPHTASKLKVWEGSYGGHHGTSWSPS